MDIIFTMFGMIGFIAAIVILLLLAAIYGVVYCATIVSCAKEEFKK